MAIEEKQIVEFIDASPQRTIFCYPWWLKAVAGERYQYVTLTNDSEIQALLPITTRSKMGFSLCAMPPFTQTLGVLLPPIEGKKANRLGREHKIMEALSRILPCYNYYNFRMHPSITNWLPFYWNGFRQTTRYTYMLSDISDLSRIWDEMRSNIRTDIKKAEKQVSVSESQNIELLIDLYEKTYRRQDKEPTHPPGVVRAIYEACSARDQCKLFVAQDGAGRTHNALLLVWDDRVAHYLIGGSDPALRNSGAGSLVMWEAIQFASTVVRQFNFEGSMVRSIERFFRACGGEQTPFFELYKYRPEFLGIVDLIF